MFEKEIYISMDIESDGPIPGKNSMLSLGAAAFLSSGKLVDTFSINLVPLSGAKQDPKTMTEFWEKNPEAWKAATDNPFVAGAAMNKFYEWVEDTAHKHKKKPVAAAYPAGFDFMFVYWYLIEFCGKSPFSFSCLDIKSLVMPILKKGYRNCTKRNMPKRWFSDDPHTHVAVEDAIEQGKLLCNILKEIK